MPHGNIFEYDHAAWFEQTIDGLAECGITIDKQIRANLSGWFKACKPGWELDWPCHYGDMPMDLRTKYRPCYGTRLVISIHCDCVRENLAQWVIDMESGAESVKQLDVAAMLQVRR